MKTYKEQANRLVDLWNCQRIKYNDNEIRLMIKTLLYAGEYFEDTCTMNMQMWKEINNSMDKLRGILKQ